MDTEFSKQIKVLIELQKVDAQIYLLKKELQEMPGVEKSAAAKFEKQKIGLKTAEDQLKSLQLSLKQKEGDLQAHEEKIKKLQSQLYQLKSNKEYATMDLEIKGLKADNSLAEEEILKKMDAVDEARKQIAKEKELLAEEEKKYKQETEAVKKRSSEIAAQLKDYEHQRSAYVPNVEKRLLSQYDRLLKGREGIALAPVVDGACGGCHLDLPPQTVNEVNLQEKLVTCESCARILYWVD